MMPGSSSATSRSSARVAEAAEQAEVGPLRVELQPVDALEAELGQRPPGRLDRGQLDGPLDLEQRREGVAAQAGPGAAVAGWSRTARRSSGTARPPRRARRRSGCRSSAGGSPPHSCSYALELALVGLEGDADRVLRNATATWDASPGRRRRRRAPAAPPRAPAAGGSCRRRSTEGAQSRRDVDDLVVAQLWVQRQAQDVLRQPLGHRKLEPDRRQPAVWRVAVDGRRVVDERPDPCRSAGAPRARPGRAPRPRTGGRRGGAREARPGAAPGRLPAPPCRPTAISRAALVPGARGTEGAFAGRPPGARRDGC